MSESDELWSMKDVCGYFKCGRSSVYRWVAQKLVPPPFKVGDGRLARWRKSEIVGRPFPQVGK